MNYITAGFQQISTSAQGVGVHEQVEINDIIADRAGYLLAYLSNENSEAVNIHFDDFEVRHAKTNVVQAIDYYPFGLEAMTYTRTAADPSKTPLFTSTNLSQLRDKLSSLYELHHSRLSADQHECTGCRST
ncbi:MAG: hypothetical protein RLN88_00250 [Ekhidna sp.]|uniref:hypothetical protein n=1 Tax=Ekhidna sp. TaxID=2608089 RepID=UPI0032EB50B7